MILYHLIDDAMTLYHLIYSITICICAEAAVSGPQGGRKRPPRHNPCAHALSPSDHESPSPCPLPQVPSGVIDGGPRAGLPPRPGALASLSPRHRSPFTPSRSAWLRFVSFYSSSAQLRNLLAFFVTGASEMEHRSQPSLVVATMGHNCLEGHKVARCRPLRPSLRPVFIQAQVARPCLTNLTCFDFVPHLEFSSPLSHFSFSVAPQYGTASPVSPLEDLSSATDSDSSEASFQSYANISDESDSETDLTSAKHTSPEPPGLPSNRSHLKALADYSDDPDDDTDEDIQDVPLDYGRSENTKIRGARIEKRWHK